MIAGHFVNKLSNYIGFYGGIYIVGLFLFP